MSGRWKAVRKEYRRHLTYWGVNSRRVGRLAMALAQRAVRVDFGGPEYDTSTWRRRRFAPPSYVSWCPCIEPTHYAVATYDDWGDGPQCTMCGRIKEGEDE